MIQRIVPFDAILLYINDPERKALVAPLPYNFDQLKTGELVLPHQEPIVQSLMGQRKSTTRIEPEVGLLPDMKVELCMPLYSPQHFLGCLYLARSSNEVFLPENVKFIEYAAGALAVALERTEWQSKYQHLDQTSNFRKDTSHTFLQALPFPALLADRRENKILDANELFLKMTGASREQAREKPLPAFINTQNLPLFGEIKTNIIKNMGKSTERSVFCSQLDPKNPARILLVVGESPKRTNRIENILPELAKLTSARFEDMVARLALLLKKNVNFDYLSLSLMDENTSHALVYDLAAGDMRKQLPNGREWRAIDDGTMGWVTIGQQPDDSEQSAPAGAHPRRMPYTLPAHMSVLLLSGEKYLGNLALGRRENMPFSEDDLTLLRALSGPVAVLIDNNQLENRKISQKPVPVPIDSEKLVAELVEKLKKFINASNVYAIKLDKGPGPEAIFDLMPEIIQQYLSGVQIAQILRRLEREKQALFVDTPEKFIKEFRLTEPAEKLVFFQPFIMAPVLLQNRLIAAVVAVWNSRHTLVKEELDVITAFIANGSGEKQGPDIKPVQQQPEPQDVNHEMENFVHTVSHELKSPLQTVKSYASLLNDDYRQDMPPGAQTCLERILVNLDQMEKLITDLLVLSRLEEQAIQREDLNAKQIVREALDSLVGALKKYPARIQIQKEMPRIFAHRTGVRQIITNLVSNALKFTANVDGPLIEIGSADTGDMIEFYVKDNGSGIAPDMREKVFELFYTKSPDKQSKGTGVGLALVKKIVSLHGGSVWIESGPGEGTVVKFTIPKK